MSEFFRTVLNELTSSESLWFIFFHIVAWLIGLITGYFIWGRKVKALEADKIELRGKLRKLEGEYKELSTENEKNVNLIATLSGDLDTEREKNKLLENEKGDLHSELLLVKAARGEQDELILKLNNEKDSLSTQLSNEAMSYKSSISGLNADLDARTANLGDLQAQIGTLEGDVSSKNSLIDDLEAKIAELIGTNAKLNTDLNLGAGNIGDLEGKIGKLEADLTGKSTLINDLNAKIGDLEGANAQLGADLELKAGSSADLSAKLGELESANAQLNADLAAKNDLVANLESSASALNAKISNLEEEKAAAASMVMSRTLDAKPAKLTKEEKAALAAVAASEVKDLIGSHIPAATAADKDDLKVISGVGPFIETKLNNLGIWTYEQISYFDKRMVKKVTDAIQFFPGRIERDKWIPQAKGLSSRDMSASDKARTAIANILGTRIPMATASDKDDLKVISGVGSFIEEKLNNLGIYTYEQVSLFDKDFIEKVTDAIEFFPGRIERDNWVSQAKELFEAK